MVGRERMRGFHDNWIIIPLFLVAIALSVWRWATLLKDNQNYDLFSPEAARQLVPWIIGAGLAVAVALMVSRLARRKKRNRRET